MTGATYPAAKTVAQAAESLGITEAAVRVAIGRGTLKADRAYGLIVIPDAEVERYRAEHLGRKGRRP